MSLTRGARLGPYLIHTEIGAGGMGHVFRATDTRLDRAVAIKELPEHRLSDPQLDLRFEREARAMALARHERRSAAFVRSRRPQCRLRLRSRGNVDLWELMLDSSGLRRLTDHAASIGIRSPAARRFSSARIGADTTSTRRQLTSSKFAPETYAISPDGTRAILSVIEEVSGGMMAEGVEGIAR